MAEDDLIEGLKALAHPLRWRILTTLSGGERNVGELEQATGIVQPGLSQQLGVLRKAGLVATRKDAKLVFYSLAEAQIGESLARLAARDVTQRDRAGLHAIHRRIGRIFEPVALARMY